MSPTPPEGPVVVVTGASSGIGRETALLLARRGARLVLVARRGDVLEAVCDECGRLGGIAIPVAADMSDERSAERVVATALDTYGRIDVWVNNAGVLSAGRFLDTPPEVFRQVVETNLFGYVYGARAVLPVFLRQQRGVLVNNASVLGTVGVAYLTPYVASKFAIRGFTEALRQELRETPVEVCTVMPSTIATAIWSHAANFTGRQLRLLPPYFAASDVASAIVSCVYRPRPEVTVGWTGWVIRAGRLVPARMFDLVAGRLAGLVLGDAPAQQSVGNLFSGMGPARVAADVVRLPDAAVRRLVPQGREQA